MDYDSFSAIYDLSCRGVEGDVDFFIQKAKKAKGDILEVGCGTGRIYLELRKKAGVNVIGIDNSEKMLSLLEKKAKSMGVSTEVYFQSVTELFAETRYDLILLPYRMFMHLYETEDQLKVLKKLGEALLKDGEIIIDLFNPDMNRIMQKYSFVLLDTRPEGLIWLWEEFDIERQVVKNIFKVERINADGVITETTVKEFQARWFFFKEFENLVKSANLKVVQIYSDYYGNKFTGTEDKMIWVLKR